MTDGLVIGAGPAGLMAAEAMADAGMAVTIADHMPSPARKFLMAGKSGLNLTKDEPMGQFLAAFGTIPEPLEHAIRGFGPRDVIGWAEELGQELFAGSTGRVFPVRMKASPLLRAWLARLGQKGVVLRTRWEWKGWSSSGAHVFATPDEMLEVRPDATVLALGGASWPRLGSTGIWPEGLPPIAPFRPTNMGFGVAWSDRMERFYGQPLKGIVLTSGDLASRGEIAISARGLEGGGIYEVSRTVRDGEPLIIDLKPDWTVEKLRNAISVPRRKSSLSNHLRKAARLGPLQIALLNEFGRPFPDDLAALIKGLPVHHEGPRPLAEAISTAGGLQFRDLTGDLMLRDRPGVFAAGEMLDWEAPTGGYLITACLATGRMAGEAAARYADVAIARA